HVQAAGTAYPHDQAFYDQQAAQQIAQFLAQGEGFRASGLDQANNSPAPLVVAGIGNGIVDVMRFLPDTRTIAAGQSVTWSNRDPETPHTVPFGTPPAGPPTTVTGTDRPGHATISSVGQSVSSGFIGAPFPNGTDFQVTFTNPGTYTYICLLHADL